VIESVGESVSHDRRWLSWREVPRRMRTRFGWRISKRLQREGRRSLIVEEGLAMREMDFPEREQNLTSMTIGVGVKK
jgi:hypothetical protein